MKDNRFEKRALSLESDHRESCFVLFLFTTLTGHVVQGADSLVHRFLKDDFVAEDYNLVRITA